MSPLVRPSPSPGASSGSLEVTETSRAVTAGSHRSLTCHPTCTGTKRWFGGHRIVESVTSASEGGVVSRTVTLVAQVATFPDASVAVKLTGVVPSEYVPEASPPPLRLLVTATVGPQASDAVATNCADAPSSPVH